MKEKYQIFVIFSILIIIIFPLVQSNILTYKIEEDNSAELVLTNWIGCYSVCAKKDGESCKLYCHIPVIHEGQSPIMVNDIWGEPSGKIKEYKINKKYSGDNALLEISFENLNYNQEINVFFNISTLIKSKNYEDLPIFLDITSEENLPDEVKKWLISTYFIQSDNFIINLVAKLLKGFNKNLIEIANHTTFFTGKIIKYKGGASQKALSTLIRTFGVCTGKANLGAALLRANGIPARVLMVYPTHYIVEYYAHPYGWIRSETTRGITPYPNKRNTIVYCAHPEDESSFNKFNGIRPYAGIIAYWGTSNLKVIYDIEYGNWQNLVNHNITLSEDKSDDSLSYTKKAWNYYMNYTGNNLNSEQKILYNQAIDYQEKAIKCFMQDDELGYIDNMQLACYNYGQI